LNRDLVDHLFDLPLSFFERTRKGDVTVRLQDCLRVQTGAVQILSSGIIDGMLVIGSLVGLALLAPPLTWIAIVALPLYGSLLVWSAREL
jgi:ATP-binding cassette subfamily B protein RaxB